MTDRFFYLKIKQAGRIQRPRQTQQGWFVQRTGHDKTNETRLVGAAATTCRGPTGVAANRNAGAHGRVTIHRDRVKKSATNTIIIFYFYKRNTAAR